MTEIRSDGMYVARRKISEGNEDDRMKFSFLAVFPPGRPQADRKNRWGGTRGGWNPRPRVTAKPKAEQ